MYIASGSAARAPSSKATDGEVGVISRSKSSKAGGEVAGDQRPDLLGAEVVGVVEARRQRVGAEHDPALDLGPEAGRAGPLVHLVERVGLDAEAEADAVVAGEVRRRLGRGEDVVGGDAVPRVRQRRSRPPRPRAPRRARPSARRSRELPVSIPSASLLSSRGTPIRRPFRSSRVGIAIGSGNADRGRVARRRGRRAHRGAGPRRGRRA